MVSPPYKGGFGASLIEGVAPEGEAVAYYSPGVFAGAPGGLSGNLDQVPYLARRGPSGWSTVPLMQPDALAPWANTDDISPTLGTVLAVVKPSSNFASADVEGAVDQVDLHDTNTPDVSANWEVAGGLSLRTLPEQAFDLRLDLRYEGASGDFCHIFVNNAASVGNGGGPLLEQAVGTVAPVYEVNRGCDGEPSGLHLVALDNAGHPFSKSCEIELGETFNPIAAQSEFNAIADDGKAVFFRACAEGKTRQIFVRLNAAKTLEVSKPLSPGSPSEACGAEEIPCKGSAQREPSYFAGASEDGSEVFFTTTASLLAGDRDTGSDLYMATIGCPLAAPGCDVAGRQVTSLTQVSHDPSGGEAAVQGVVRIAPDGSRAYFVAHGDLLTVAAQEALESEQHAVPHVGAENLYVYDGGSGEVAFIGELCSGAELSGTVGDVQCPSASGEDGSLWKEEQIEAQTAGTDGRYLLFSTYAQLSPNDTDAARDIYRYDAQAGVLNRVSLGEAGYDANGNNSEFDATIRRSHAGGTVEYQDRLNSREISEDGSRVIFESQEPLSPSATNHLENAYEWYLRPGEGEGEVSLISTGSAAEPVEDAVISPSGRDVFFVTTQGLVPQDTDGAPDVYDARLGGGFRPAPSAPQPCAGDACQGPLTNPAPLLVPGSVSQEPGENLPAPGEAATTTPKQKRKVTKQKRVRARKRSKHTGGKHKLGHARSVNTTKRRGRR
jgi:hypothetical protein